MIKIFTNKFFLKPQFRRQIFPILLDIHFLKNKDVLDIYSLVDDIKNADIAVFPIEFSNAILKHKFEVEKFLKESKKQRLPIWVYTGGDFGYTLSDDNIYNFRLGGFKSKLNSKTIIMPSFLPDPYSKILKQNFKTISKTEQPSIGFVGHANKSLLKFIAEYKGYLKNNLVKILKTKKRDYQSFFPSSHERYFCLMRFKKNQEINSNFILRKRYRAGAKTQEDRIRTTQEFYENIYQNQYTFCMRGGGNFSVRFYETLAVGRIPILLDTDCRLPLYENIDWKKHTLIVDYKDRKNIDEKILEYHKSISNDQFIKIQENNRLLWKEQLNRVSFFKQIHNIFISKYL